MNKLQLLEVAKTYEHISTKVKNNLVDYYNEHCNHYVKKSRKYSMTNNDNWCAMFTSVCAHIVGYDGCSFPFEVSVYQQCLIAKNRGTFVKSVDGVEVGDLITYNWNGDYIPDHVGIIESIENGVIRVIEGNYSNTVKIRTVTVESKNIYGFIKL